jgi:uncharacterized Fe-S cluster protein YjdI
MKSHSYSNGDIRVVWTPEKCIHSTHCWKQLRSVFDPGKKPWIHMDGAPTERILQQVQRCPSGALTYVLDRTDGDLEGNSTTEHG